MNARLLHRLGLGPASRLIAVLIIAVSVAPPAVDARSTEARPAQQLEIIDRAIDHHGGDRYRSSETNLDVCSKSGCAHVQARIDGSQFDLTVRAAAREGERTVRITNDRVERWRDGEPVAVAPDEAQPLRDWVMARVYFPFLPFRLNDPSVWKEDRGLEVWDGRPLRRVKVTFTPGSSTEADDEYVYWLDPESGEVVSFAYSYQGEPGGLRFRRATKPRRIGGILFFDQENYGTEGDGLSVDDIDPDFVRGLRHVSTVALRNVVVRSLEPESPQ